MTYEEAKTKPLNELLPFLILSATCAITCKAETWGKEFDDSITVSEIKKIICQKRGKYDNCPQRIAYERVMEACEKQIPKKVIFESDGEADGAPVYDLAFCPNCDKAFSEGSSGWECKCCSNCGQALDWSDEE